MRLHLSICHTFVAFAALSVILSTRTVSADYLLTVGGTFASSSNVTDRFDGTNDFDDLPPLLNLARLQGGTFSATYTYQGFVPVVGSDAAFYDFVGPSYGVTYTLFDANGAVVHQGSSPSDAFALIFNNAVSPSGVFDEALFASFANTVTGVTTPTTFYTADQNLSAIQSSLIFYGAMTSSTNYLNDLAIPTDAATLMAFPTRRFSTGLEWTDGDPYAFDGTPYQIIDTSVSYDITSVRLTSVPEPGSLILLAIAGVPGAAAWLLRRGKHRPSSWASRPSRLSGGPAAIVT